MAFITHKFVDPQLLSKDYYNNINRSLLIIKEKLIAAAIFSYVIPKYLY